MKVDVGLLSLGVILAIGGVTWGGIFGLALFVIGVVVFAFGLGGVFWQWVRR